VGGPALLTLLAATLVGCGSAERAPDRGAQAARPPSLSSAQSPDRTSLAIAVENPAGGWRSYTLTCGPDGGTHPMPQLACRVLEVADGPFQSQTAWEQGRRCFPLPSNQHAVITGTWRGDQVAVKYDQTSTCAAERWGTIAVVFLPMNAAATDPPLLD
jgi:hypothetical protein